MKRVGALIVTLAAALAATATPASAGVLSGARAYGVANSIGQAAHRQGYGWRDGCSRTTPWRYGCWVQVWTASDSVDCTVYFDVVSPAFGSRLRLENSSGWEC
jgi:hypothetical protein